MTNFDELRYVRMTMGPRSDRVVFRLQGRLVSSRVTVCQECAALKLGVPGMCQG